MGDEGQTADEKIMDGRSIRTALRDCGMTEAAGAGKIRMGRDGDCMESDCMNSDCIDSDCMDNRTSGKTDKTEKKRPMIVLSGPTAVGKTKLSIALAKAVDGEILSADSMQVYRHMDIGSAKITRQEMEGVPHHMIDILEPWEEFSVAVFQDRCRECLSGIYARGHIPVVAGGTGFYVQALLRDIDFSGPQIPERGDEGDESALPGYRASLEALAEEKGNAYLHSMLTKLDPASGAGIHPNNRKRVIRALEYFRLTGEPISLHNEREREKPSAYDSCYFVLNDSRERLYARIDRRVDEMLEKGLVEEVEELRRMGCHRGMVSMQGLGYKEILAYLEGETTLEEAVEILKRDTRHFAKRQLTWFRREKDVIWVNKNEFRYDEEQILQYMLERAQGVVKRWSGADEY